MSEYELLERRVSTVEQELEGEKLVIRHVLEQTRRNSDDLASIKARQNAHDARFDRLEAELRSLNRDLPGVIAETLREVLREERR